MAKKKKEIRDMSKDQLIDHVEALKKELFNLKIEISCIQRLNVKIPRIKFIKICQFFSISILNFVFIFSPK